MRFVPKLLLKQLYTRGSLNNTETGIQFSVKNRLKDAQLKGIEHISIDGKEIDLDLVEITDGKREAIPVKTINKSYTVDFPLKKTIIFNIKTEHLDEGKYKLKFVIYADPFGKLEFEVEDSVRIKVEEENKIPRDAIDDYNEKIITDRIDFIENYSNTKLEHIKHYSFDPQILQGNIEHFIGVAQVPLGLAGPILVNGEHAKGEFIIPMATTEGTLVASYNRGMKVLNESGGVTTTILDDAMQRAPVFVFESARGVRHFVQWVKDHEREIADQAEGTSSVAKLTYIDTITSNKFAYLRFNYYTGDAAGQNMVGRATFVACSWILESYKENRIVNFFLESNLATDKKASQINVMRTRGKRVVAEAIVKRDVLLRRMRVDPKNLTYHSLVANVGAILSGANNNGLHSANGITAMFMATGQDVANVAESSAGLLYTELTEEGDLYISITIPSLIVATYGGGTNLATQNENLAILGCVGKGKVNKLAEIIAAVVLAGEISLASAISSSDWVSSHEEFGRNR
ncbi:MAG: hydroxymethylglutaryl-CoA reductase [Bacteroidales bacterium]|nr:hydroxymethylglutaryl-CoA reductase [Bacteroidales bacterium]